MENALEKSLERFLADDQWSCPPNLREAIRYSLLAPGKRIRPRLCLMTGRMLKVDEEALLAAGVALEMVHCFTLIHDDLPCMDDDDYRRGKPTNHKVFGEAIALLAGDALMTLPFDALLDGTKHLESEKVLRAVRRLTWAAGPRGVIGGQAAEALLDDSSNIDALRKMHAMKTGALFIASVALPMDLAGVLESSEDGQLLMALGRTLGLAFQVADDLDDGEQDRSEKNPRSILYYQSSREAAENTHRTLESIRVQVRERWGAQAQEVDLIAGEVQKSLKRFLV